MAAYGIAVLSFFSSGVSVILILKRGLAVSSSTVVPCKKDPSRYCGTVHRALLHVNIFKTLD